MKERIQKVRELGKHDYTALPLLTPYLADPDTEVRLEAVKAIVRIDTTRSLDPLIEASRDNNSEVQIRAIDGLVNVYLPGYVTRNNLTGTVTRGVRQVKAIFASRNDQIVDADVRIRPDVAQALAERINVGNGMDARADAALAAGILRARDAVPALEKGLHSKNSDLIFECLIALQKIQDPSAGSSVDFLARDLDDRIQSTALETLGVLRSVDSAGDVRYALTNARNVRIRRAALEALAMLAISSDRATFQQYAADAAPELRAAALEGLGRIREPEDYPKLEAAFNEANTDWRVHLAAGFGMVNQGNLNTEDLSPLSYLLEGFDVKVRTNTTTAYLVELARQDSVRKALAKMLPEATKDQKVGIFGVLSTVGGPDVVPVLQQYTRDQDSDVALGAARALRIAQARRS